MIQDSMDVADDEIEDTDVDNLIANMETDIRNKKQKNFEAEMGEEEEQL
jgi:hypothetical protein